MKFSVYHHHHLSPLSLKSIEKEKTSKNLIGISSIIVLHIKNHNDFGTETAVLILQYIQESKKMA
jgi:hypothetical protein